MGDIVFAIPADESFYETAKTSLIFFYYQYIHDIAALKLAKQINDTSNLQTLKRKQVENTAELKRAVSGISRFIFQFNIHATDPYMLQLKQNLEHKLNDLQYNNPYKRSAKPQKKTPVHLTLERSLEIINAVIYQRLAIFADYAYLKTRLAAAKLFNSKNITESSETVSQIFQAWYQTLADIYTIENDGELPVEDSERWSIFVYKKHVEAAFENGLSVGQDEYYLGVIAAYNSEIYNLLSYSAWLAYAHDKYQYLLALQHLRTALQNNAQDQISATLERCEQLREILNLSGYEVSVPHEQDEFDDLVFKKAKIEINPLITQQLSQRQQELINNIIALRFPEKQITPDYTYSEDFGNYSIYALACSKLLNAKAEDVAQLSSEWQRALANYLKNPNDTYDVDDVNSNVDAQSFFKNPEYYAEFINNYHMLLLAKTRLLNNNPDQALFVYDADLLEAIEFGAQAVFVNRLSDFIYARTNLNQAKQQPGRNIDNELEFYRQTALRLEGIVTVPSPDADYAELMRLKAQYEAEAEANDQPRQQRQRELIAAMITNIYPDMAADPNTIDSNLNIELINPSYTDNIMPRASYNAASYNAASYNEACYNEERNMGEITLDKDIELALQLRQEGKTEVVEEIEQRIAQACAEPMNLPDEPQEQQITVPDDNGGAKVITIQKPSQRKVAEYYRDRAEFIQVLNKQVTSLNSDAEHQSDLQALANLADLNNGNWTTDDIMQGVPERKKQEIQARIIARWNSQEYVACIEKMQKYGITIPTTYWSVTELVDAAIPRPPNDMPNAQAHELLLSIAFTRFDRQAVNADIQAAQECRALPGLLDTIKKQHSTETTDNKYYQALKDLYLRFACEFINKYNANKQHTHGKWLQVCRANLNYNRTADQLRDDLNVHTAAIEQLPILNLENMQKPNNSVEAGRTCELTKAVVDQFSAKMSNNGPAQSENTGAANTTANTTKVSTKQPAPDSLEGRLIATAIKQETRLKNLPSYKIQKDKIAKANKIETARKAYEAAFSADDATVESKLQTLLFQLHEKRTQRSFFNATSWNAVDSKMRKKFKARA